MQKSDMETGSLIEKGDLWVFMELFGLKGVKHHCGLSRRALLPLFGFGVQVHYTEFTNYTKEHAHPVATEVYIVLEAGADARIKVDGVEKPVKAWQVMGIKPGCMHQGLGHMKVLILILPFQHEHDEVLPEKKS